MEHISLLAREQIEAQNAQQIQQISQQYGGEIPPELQRQFQEEMEKQIAVKITEFIEEMFIEEQQSMEGQGEDPLVALKQQEINIKAQDLQRKIEKDEADIAIDQDRIDADAKQHQDKIDSQEDIAQLRANVNLTKQKEIEKSKKDPVKIDEQRDIRFDN